MYFIKLPLLSLAILSVFCFTTCTPTPADHCTLDKLRVEMDTADCCDGVFSIPVPDTNQVVLQLDTSAVFPIIYCPCDSTIALVDTTEFSDEERAAVAASDATPEGNIIFQLPVPGILDISLINRKKTTQQQDVSPGQNALRIAILDSGLSEEALSDHNHEIAEKMEMFTFTSDIKDSLYHGTVVFSLIDAEIRDNVRYYMYKCVNADGKGTAFQIACALRCADLNDVDIINISLGAYVNSQLVQYAINSVSQETAIISSEGNDCIQTDSLEHYPSGYERVYGIAGIGDTATTAMERRYLWRCSNGYKNEKNVAAPAKVVSDEETGYGTSFSAAYTSGRFAVYLDNFSATDPQKQFRNDFLTNSDYTHSDTLRFLLSAGDCVEVDIVK